MKTVPMVLLVAAIIAAVALAGSGLGARFGWWDYRGGFALLRFAMFGSLALAVIAAVALLILRVRTGGARVLIAALLVACVTSAVPFYWLAEARKVPPI